MQVGNVRKENTRTGTLITDIELHLSFDELKKLEKWCDVYVDGNLAIIASDGYSFVPLKQDTELLELSRTMTKIKNRLEEGEKWNF